MLGVTFGVFLAWAMHKETSQIFRLFGLIGIVCGAIFALSTDQGVLSLLYFTGGICISFMQYAKRKSVRETVESHARMIISFTVGYVIGILPLLLYLVRAGALSSFISAFIQLFMIGSYAKIPFIPYAMQKENILVLLILLGGVVSVLYTLFLDKKKTCKERDYVQMALVFALFLIELKNIMRPMVYPVMLYAFFVFVTLWEDIKERAKKYISPVHTNLYYSQILILFILILGLQGYIRTKLFSFPTIHTNISLKVRDVFQTLKGSSCISNKFSANALPLQENYREVLEYIKNELQYSGKVYSFPSDPVFYVLFEQQPSPYLNGYDGSPSFAQKKTIQFLIDKNVEYVVYNTSDTTIDGVPFVLREPELHKYIVTHYAQVEKVIEPFVLLRKSTGDLYNEEFLPEKLASSGRTINLEMLPHAYNDRKTLYTPIVMANTIVELNSYIQNNPVESENILIEIQPSLSTAEYTRLLIHDDSGYDTEIVYRSCPVGKKCLIPLKIIPYFYLQRKINGIRIDEAFQGTISLFRMSEK
jgi:hypothetical protein